ncbi:MAG: hypothetical protein NWF05_11015 [Candidatus Bathyarchaeota archaeon]|nr:hypothetical protein [Candidatus Bathyarchaeota archaeon]
MKKFRAVSEKETERLVNRFMRQAQKYKLAFTDTGIPCLILENSEALAVDKDGSLTWKTKLWFCNGHVFIQLITGTNRKKTAYLPICLLNPKTRRIAEALLSTTIGSVDGRFCSKKADICVGNCDGKLFRISLDLTGLSFEYLTIEMSCGSFLPNLKSACCPFCREIFG